MKKPESMSVEELELRRAYDRAVRRWKTIMRQGGYTLAAWQDVHVAGERLKAFFAERNRDF